MRRMAPQHDQQALERFRTAVDAGDVASMRDVVATHASLAGDIDHRCFDVEAPAIVHAACGGDRDMVDALLELGASIHARSAYWGRTIGVLDESPPELHAFLVERGAVAAITPFVEAVKSGRVDDVRRLLDDEPRLTELIDQPFFSFGTPAIVVARNDRAMLELLLDHGADINARSAHDFGVLDDASTEIAAWLIERGAIVTIHVAAALGMHDRVRELLAQNADLVHARGGDGRTALHGAADARMVDLLVDHGADIDARCEDHASTPLQYLINETEIARRLIERGAHADILVAAALGDIDLIQAELARCPTGIHARNHQHGYEPVRPGSITSWKIGFKLSPHQAAHKYGHADAFEYLMSVSPAAEQLINACLCGQDDRARAIAADHPDLVAGLAERDRTRFADAAWCGNLPAARLMLELGFDPDTPYDEGPAIMGACLFGNHAMIRLLLDHDADISWKNDYGSDALGTTVWASKNFCASEGDYVACVQEFIHAGLPIEPWMLRAGSDAVNTALGELTGP